jgi:hypothetical protein
VTGRWSGHIKVSFNLKLSSAFNIHIIQQLAVTDTTGWPKKGMFLRLPGCETASMVAMHRGFQVISCLHPQEKKNYYFKEYSKSPPNKSEVQ